MVPGLVAVLFSRCLMYDRSSAFTRPSWVASPRSTLNRKAKSPPGAPLPLGNVSVVSAHSPSRPATSASSRNRRTLSLVIGVDKVQVPVLVEAS